MSDSFQTYAKGLHSPADRHVAITASDTVDITPRPRAIYCQTAGNLRLRDSAGTELTYAVTAGQTLPFRAARVMLTGTTATVFGWD